MKKIVLCVGVIGASLVLSGNATAWEDDAYSGYESESTSAGQRVHHEGSFGPRHEGYRGEELGYSDVFTEDYAGAGPMTSEESLTAGVDYSTGTQSPEDEKARKKAEKKAEKERKRAEKEGKKGKKGKMSKEEKKAEKERKKAEKKAKKDAKHARGTQQAEEFPASEGTF
ncbi:MAG: hypothetical protein LBL99_00290 [Holosporaceae bacterium]|jgi:hypothetical protein|nr:hypothetical protein [Holosporaceae bacterium]